jgi:hypothetical protein
MQVSYQYIVSKCCGLSVKAGFISIYCQKSGGLTKSRDVHTSIMSVDVVVSQSQCRFHTSILSVHVVVSQSQGIVSNQYIVSKYYGL